MTEPGTASFTNQGIASRQQALHLRIAPCSATGDDCAREIYRRAQCAARYAFDFVMSCTRFQGGGRRLLQAPPHELREIDQSPMARRWRTNKNAPTFVQGRCVSRITRRALQSRRTASASSFWRTSLKPQSLENSIDAGHLILLHPSRNPGSRSLTPNRSVIR